MKTVDEMIQDILRREGGFVDDPTDRGGATKHGVSLRYMRGIGLDLDGDGDVDVDDVREVTPKIAAELFKEDFLYKPKLDQLPDCLHPQLFDISVHSGPPRAVMILQECLTRSYGADLRADGRVGPKTRRAAEGAVERYGFKAVNNSLVDTRITFFLGIFERDPGQRRFERGWLRRAEEFRLS